jgi:hypothetical protein
VGTQRLRRGNRFEKDRRGQRVVVVDEKGGKHDVLHPLLILKVEESTASPPH